MNTLPKLPEYIHCATTELTILLSLMLKERGFQLDGNLHDKVDVINACWFREHGHRIRITISAGYACRQADGHAAPGDFIVKGFDDLCKLFNPAPKITVGEHIVEKKDTGVQVGCTFVPWETVRQIAALEHEA